MTAARSAMAFIAGIAVLTPACAASKSLPITVRIRGATTCYALVDGSEFRLPDDARSFAQRLKQLRKKWRSASIVGDTDVPYRCVGGVVYLAQSAKFKKVGFLAQPPQ